MGRMPDWCSRRLLVPCRKSGLQGQEAGGREACWEVTRHWADKDGGISLGYIIYIELSDIWAYSREVEGSRKQHSSSRRGRGFESLEPGHPAEGRNR